MTAIVDYDTIVIYHEKCLCAHAAVYAFKQLCGIRMRRHQQILYMPMLHRTLSIKMLARKRVYIIDLFLSLDIIDQIANVAKLLTVVGGPDKLVNPILTHIFDATKCSAELMWNHLHNPELTPWWMPYVHDYKFRSWKHKDSRAFIYALMELRQYDHTFKIIDKYDEPMREIFLSGGRKLMIESIQNVEKICKTAQVYKFMEYHVAVIRARRDREEIGDNLALNTDCDFALIYCNHNHSHQWKISLRGDSVKLAKRGIDLNAVAGVFGGRGTPTSASFTYLGNIEDILHPLRTQKISKCEML